MVCADLTGAKKQGKSFTMMATNSIQDRKAGAGKAGGGAAAGYGVATDRGAAAPVVFFCVEALTGAREDKRAFWLACGP